MVPAENTYLLVDLHRNGEITKINIYDEKCVRTELTSEDLEYYVAHPSWIKVRLFLFWFFWAAFLVMLILLILIYNFIIPPMDGSL